MWHKKQNMALPGQMTGPPRPPPPPLENLIAAAPFCLADKDSLGESSRKRKASILTKRESNFSDGTIESVLEDPFPRESYPCHGNSALSVIDMQRNSHGTSSSQIAESRKPNTENTQFGNHQHRHPTNFSTTWQNNDMNLPQFAVEKMDNLRMLPQSFHQKGPSPSVKAASEEIHPTHDRRHLAHNTSSQIQADTFSFNLNSGDAFFGKAHDGTPLKDKMIFGHGNQFSAASPSVELNSVSSGSLRSLEMSEHTLDENGKLMHPAKSEGKEGSQSTSSIASSIEVQDGAQDSNISWKTSVSIEGKKNDQSCENSDIEIRSGSSDVGLGVNLKGRDQSPAHKDVNDVKKTVGSDSGNVKLTSSEEISPGNAGNPAKPHVQYSHGYDQHNNSLSMDGKRKSLAGKVAPPSIEKLWDGSLQLNASVTVSAVAFFKSGEKAPEINWSKFVEVKGKVRLEAFEKFIQELPRSRNRGLMVISLCWKAGSSKSGLLGMKEVAKGYKEGERVGFAQLSQGIDLYVCPRSETIITILAKYGFFKGMAAVEEDQDSLIGCVVWRRNRALSNTNVALKKPEGKNLQSAEKTLTSPSDSAIIQAMEINPSIAVAQGSSSLDSGVECTPIESSGSIGAENKIVHSSSLQLGASNSFISAKPEPTSVSNSSVPTPAPTNCQVIPVRLQSALPPNSSSLWGNSFTYLNANQAPLPNNSPPNSGPSNPQVMSRGPESTSVSNNSLPTHGPDNSPVTPMELQSALPSSSSSLSGNSFTYLNAKQTPAPNSSPPNRVPNSSQAIPMGPQPALIADVNSLRQLIEQSLQAGVPLQGLPGSEMSDRSFDQMKPAISLPSQVVKRRASATDYDDLPEFDFKEACGVSESTLNKPLLPPNSAYVLDTGLSGNKLSAAGARKVDGSMQSKVTVQPLTAVSQQKPHILTLPGLALDANHGIHPLKKPGEHEMQFQTFSLSDGKPGFNSSEVLRGSVTSKPSNCAAITPKRNLWDDDDDMPEWCPPDQEHQNQPLSIPKIPSVIPNQSFGKVPSAGSRPPFSSPSQVPIGPVSSTQGLPHRYQHCPITITVKPETRPVGGNIQRGTSSFPGFNPNFSLRPQLNLLNIRPPSRPADGRGRKPDIPDGGR